MEDAKHMFIGVGFVGQIFKLNKLLQPRVDSLHFPKKIKNAVAMHEVVHLCVVPANFAICVQRKGTLNQLTLICIGSIPACVCARRC